MRAGASLVKEYVLRRQADLPTAGWYGGDMHTHFSRWQPSDNHVWGRFLAAEGLQAVNNMVYKHGGAIEAALGKLDFVENVQFNMFLGCVFWYRLLNCGLKLACTGGSDFPFGADLLAPWYPNLGLDRTYVSVEDGFSYEGWIAGIRRGRTFASNGPLLSFAVEGREPGSEVHLDEGCDAVAVAGRAVSNFGLHCLVSGPLEQRDLGGLDLHLALSTELWPHLDRSQESHPLVAEKVARGDLGLKSGRGFHDWSGQDPETVRRSRSEALVALLARLGEWPET